MVVEYKINKEVMVVAYLNVVGSSKEPNIDIINVTLSPSDMSTLKVDLSEH